MRIKANFSFQINITMFESSLFQLVSDRHIRSLVYICTSLNVQRHNDFFFFGNLFSCAHRKDGGHSAVEVEERVHVLFVLFVFIYVYWCPTRCSYHMMWSWRLTCRHRVPLVEQELHALSEHLSSTRVLVTFVLLNLQLSVYCSVDHCLSFWHLSFVHCIVYPSSI